MLAHSDTLFSPRPRFAQQRYLKDELIPVGVGEPSAELRDLAEIAQMEVDREVCRQVMSLFFFNEVAKPVLSDALGNPVFFDASGEFTDTIAGVGQQHEREDNRYEARY